MYMYPKVLFYFKIPKRMSLLPSSVMRTWLFLSVRDSERGPPSAPSLTKSSVLHAQLRFLFDFFIEKVKALVKDSECRIQLNGKLLITRLHQDFSKHSI